MRDRRLAARRDIVRIDKLDTSNLRDGVFCAHGKPRPDAMYDQMEA